MAGAVAFGPPINPLQTTVETAASGSFQDLENMKTFLEDLETEFADLLTRLVNVLKNTNISGARLLAGVVLKNAIRDSEDSRQIHWRDIDPETKMYIKKTLLKMLLKPKYGSAAALCCSNIAAMEMLGNSWPELFKHF